MALLALSSLIVLPGIEELQSRMSDGNQRRVFPALRTITLAIVAGAVCGAVAVYVTGGVPGNKESAAAAVVDAGSGATCAAKAAFAKSVGDAAVGQVAAMLPADPPVLLSSLAFNDPQGKPMRLGDLAGKTVLVNLWATWCAPCRAEMPALDALQSDRGSDSFEVVAINIDTGDDTKPRRFLEETGVSALGYYRDASMGVFNDLKRMGLALGLPVTLLVDEEGCLLAHMNGPAEWSSPDAVALINAAEAGRP
jgi:thiol-disulfide isomerase/thioredoxin